MEKKITELKKLIYDIGTHKCKPGDAFDLQELEFFWVAQAEGTVP